jgi:hypothetical protein
MPVNAWRNDTLLFKASCLLPLIPSHWGKCKRVHIVNAVIIITCYIIYAHHFVYLTGVKVGTISHLSWEAGLLLTSVVGARRDIRTGTGRRWGCSKAALAAGL